MTNELDVILQAGFAWSITAFPGQTVEGMKHHLLEEAGEVLTAGTKEELAEELADVMFLAYNIGSRSGVDLFDALYGKFLKNQARGWSPPDANGVIHHVAE